MEITSKHCPKCQTEKSASEFFRNKARYDGLSGYCKACQQIVNAANSQRVRAEAISGLGGPICVRCGFDDLRALVIDHIDGGGNQHRVESVSSYSFYRYVIKHPEEFQVLCCNCNQIKRHENGEWAGTEYMAKARAMDREKVTNAVRWARDHDACQGCGTTDTPHRAKGYCKSCYFRWLRRGTTEPVEDLSAFRSEMAKARWADPEEREKLTAAIKQRVSEEE